MKKLIILTILIVFLNISTGFCQSVGQVIRGQNPSGGFTFIQTDSEGILKSNVNIGSATFTFPGAMDISIASHLVPLPSGTNNIGKVTVEEMTISSETIGLISTISSITSEVIDLALQQATESSNLIAEVGSVTSKVNDLALQQATESLNLIAEVGSVTAMVEDVKDAMATVTLAIEAIDQISDFDAAYLSVTVGTSAAVIIPNIGTARQVYIFTDQDVNFGGSGVETGTSMPYIPGGAPYVKFKFTKADPAFYFRGRTATAAIRIMKAQE
jgi:hypothetical protein